MNVSKMLWLAAKYYFPATYSLRVPLSSATSALAMPAPGPATVRLALIRAGIELFGVDQVRDNFFPIIRAMSIRIRPPKQVAISKQILTLVKVNETGQARESIGYREVAQATDTMSVFVKVPRHSVDDFTQILLNISYWGQANSLTCCLQVVKRPPRAGECGIPLSMLWRKSSSGDIDASFTCLATEFRDHHVSWHEVMPEGNNTQNPVISPEIYIWPLQIIEQYSSHKLLAFRSLSRG